MPCPELDFDSFHRRPCQKKRYDNPQNRAVCRRIAKQVVAQMQMLLEGGCVIEAIIGLERSPSCGVSKLTAPPPQRIVTGQGIFIEELKVVMREAKIKIPIIGADVYRIGETVDKLANLLGGGR